MFRPMLTILLTCGFTDRALAAEEGLCSPMALRNVLEKTGIVLTIEALTDKMPNDGNNSALAELSTVARQHGLHCLSIKWSTYPDSDASPAIIPVASRTKRLHFVSVLEWRDQSAAVKDGEFSIADLRRAGWDGTALHLSKSAAELQAMRPRWWSYSRGRWIAATVVFAVLTILVMIPQQWLQWRGQ